MKRTIPKFVALALPFLLAPPSHAAEENAMRANAQLANAKYWHTRYTPTQLKKAALSLNSDYVAEDRDLSHWRKDKLTIFIDFTPVRKLKWFNQKLFELKVHQCMENWNEAVDGKFKFAMAPTKKAADISITFDTWRHNMDASKAGVTEVTTGTPEGITCAEVAIFIFDAKGHPSDEYDYERVVYHEFGHALGLNHSANQADIMYHASRMSSLSPRDRNSIRKLYGLTLTTL